MKLKEPNKHYYVLTPGIAQQSDLSSGELTLQFRHDEGESDTSSTMIHKAQEPLKVNDESLFQESVDNFVGSTKIPLSLYKTKIPEKKCVPCLNGEASYTSVVNDNMPIVGSSEKNFKIQRRPFQHEGRLPETKANAACSDGVRDLSAPPQYGMVAPSIVLQQPEQLTILELSPARPSLSRLHLKADVTDGSARKSPVTVQEWVDSLPLQLQRGEEDSEEPHQQEPDEHLDLGLGAEAGLLFAVCPEVEVSSADHGSTCKKAKHREGFVREASLQSDVTSHTGSSMESYLESRRADPEEVLLGLGFGGTAGGVRSEVSRIPRRFLQPSQVKGVAVDDFLHYQQDLIEKFETGFSGYRGLVGPSQTPSVIVAKIMEKLRDHERESSCRSSVASHLSTSTPASVPPPPPPPPAELKKFSHMARKVMKRTNVTRALSVLSPANREFLDSQGSKSPEVPRKRMIIGQRSFTFSGDGDLIEVESRPSSPSHEPSPKQVHGPAKRLVHKDSVLSLATSASMTSIDSDSDTDDRSSEYEMRNRISRPPPPTLPCCDVGPTLPTSTSTSLPANHRQRILDKRMSSTSLSSWEMETSAHSTERSNRLLDASGPSDGNVEGSKSQPNSNALSFLRTKCESIDEDVNMEVISNSHNSLNSSSIVEKVESTSDVELGMEASEELCVIPICPSDEAVLPPFFTSVQQHQTPTCLVRDQVCMLHCDKSLRRGSLKRQQHIVEDDDIDKTEEGIEDSASTLMPIAPFAVQNNENLLQMVPDTRGDSFEMEEILPLDEEKELFNLTRARSDSSGFLEGDVTENISSNNCPPSNSNSNNNNNNNNNTVNTDQALGTSESCHSTTDSGHVSESVREVVAEHEDVCMQSPATRLPSQHPEVVDASCGGVHERDLGSSTMPLDVVPAEGCDVWSMLGVWGSDRYVKRLSLPVVCVHDELGNVRSWRSCTSDDGSAVTCTVRRVRSAPQSLCDADELRAATVLQACCSFGNMFSFCSDESVIHVGARKGGARPCAYRRSSGSSSRRHSASFDNLSVQRCGHHGARHCFQEGKSRNLQLADSSKCAANDLQELIHELTARGLEVGKFFDTHNACHSESQQAHLHASTLRLAVEAYKKQLSVTPEVRPGGFQECAEAQEELEVTRGICGRITGELRHIADLLEEEPTVRMANVTCQMTELLREQTRLYEQLTSCGSGTSSVLPPDVVSLHTSLAPQADVSRSDRCCCSKQIISVVREEHGRLEQLIKKNTDELAEIRHLLCELLSKNSNV